MKSSPSFDLIVTVVNKGDAGRVVQASTRAGAEGGTILHGRGTGIHEQARLFGILIEPEKEVVLTLLPEERTQQVLSAIVRAVDLDEPGRGIAFVLPVKAVAGIAHSTSE
ncbi:MAG: P-II family nitrogen regulator [Bacillota bacterium]|nr:P-II family nitrogen regulator [Bacillota bacterium]